MGRSLDELDREDGSYNNRIAASHFRAFISDMSISDPDPGQSGEADFSDIDRDALEIVGSDWKYEDDNIGPNGLKLKPNRLWLGKGYSETTKAVQTQLIHEGYLAAGEADGYYGTKTKEAVEKFQRAHGLDDDGIFGEKSFNKMVQQYPEFSSLFGYDEI